MVWIPFFWLLCFSHSRYVYDMRGALEVRWFYACALWFEACFVFLSGNIVFVFRKISNTHLTTCCILHSHVNLTGSCIAPRNPEFGRKKRTNWPHRVNLAASKGWPMHFPRNANDCRTLFTSWGRQQVTCPPPFIFTSNKQSTIYFVLYNQFLF